MQEFRNFIYDRHDVFCNQKYADIYPYSMHLKFVEAQGEKFLHLIKDEMVVNKQNFKQLPISTHTIIRAALSAHDTMEDARMTYNDVLEKANEFFNNYTAAIVIADIVFCVSDEKGKGRKGRKNEKFYTELKQNKLAIFVKLADLAANRLYSKLTGSTMYNKYKKEWPKFKETLYLKEFEEFFEYVENI